MAHVKTKTTPKASVTLGPKGQEAVSIITTVMSKFRTDERERMIGYLKAWARDQSKKKQSTQKVA